jgi:hypothetical protein
MNSPSLPSQSQCREHRSGLRAPMSLPHLASATIKCQPPTPTPSSLDPTFSWLERGARPPFYRGRHPWRWLAGGPVDDVWWLGVVAWDTRSGGAAFHRLPWLPQMCCRSMQDHRAKACNASCVFLKAGLPKEEVKKERMGSQIQWRLPVFASTTSHSSHILTVSNDLSFVGCIGDNIWRHDAPRRPENAQIGRSKHQGGGAMVRTNDFKCGPICHLQWGLSTSNEFLSSSFWYTLFKAWWLI